MSDDAEFKRLEPEFLALARRIFDAGAKAERARVVALIQGGGTFFADSHVLPRARPRATGYGAVSTPVKEALIKLAAESAEGLGARDIAEYFKRAGSGPDERQVRAALKTLTITGEAVRASRGRYLPRTPASPPSSGEDPDAGASGGFDLAAE
jgi:hypothetical protein